MEELESRFLHLLQPIRDLTKNWEVDVAAQLGEYLEELEQVCISFDNGRTTMNFIQAALLIQGSACVYSRKVEYLYSLVYQTLDFISNKRREKQPSSVGQDGQDCDATFRATEEEEFLSLDDIQDSQANVDLRKDPAPNAVSIIPLTPISLVPPEEAEKRDNPLLSRRGELLASRRDFRMNTSTPHASGAFLLELAGLSPPCPGGQGTPGLGAAGTGALGSSGRDIVQALSFCGEGGPDDDDSIGDVAPRATEDATEMAPAAEEHVEAQRGPPRGARVYMLRELPPAQDPNTHVKELLDPWKSLDPFGDSEEKPFRKGRPFLGPQGLEDMAVGKRKRKGPRKLQDFMTWFSVAYNNVPDSEKAKRKGPTFADLEGLYWRQLRARAAAQRKLQSWGRLLPCEKELDPLEEERGSDSCQGADDSGDQEELEELEEPGAIALDPHADPPADPPDLSYEELVRRNVELFIADSQRYARETELSQHVRGWEERMGPLLQEQEDRAPFDIKSYGQALAGRCGGLGGGPGGGWCPFSHLVAGLPPFEVCRYMLAALQLANEYVVELDQAPGLEQALDTLRLRLLPPPQPPQNPPGPSQ